MLRCGVDIIEIERIRKAVLSEYGKKFLKRVYTKKELEFCENNIPELAARWAGKEAVAKALGTGLWRKKDLIDWKEIEILPDECGKPIVYLCGAASKKAKALNMGAIDISFSHTRDLAIAFAVCI